MKRRPAHDIGIEDELGCECEAFLDGRYLAWLQAEGLPVAPWAHLNRAAHGLVDDLRSDLARCGVPAHVSSFEEAALAVEALILATTAPGDLAAVQRRVLVPLELELVGRPTSPRAVVAQVALGLRGDDGRSSR